MTSQQHEASKVPQPRQPVMWGCTSHHTPRGQTCPGCADQGELFTRTGAGASTYRRRNP